MINIKKAKEKFIEYVKDYEIANPRILLKREHSIRVSELARTIAEDINENPDLAELIGLLHDIGRFEQLKQYDTMDDSVSIDHASFGVEVLKKDGFIKEFVNVDEHIQTILLAIENHNKFNIDELIVGENLEQARIIRDADKIDILNILTFESFDTLYKKESIIEEEISDAVYNGLLNHEYMPLSVRVTNIDKYLFTLAFIYDLNYSISFEILKEHNYINRLLDRLLGSYNDEKIENIRKVTNEYIDNKIKENQKHKNIVLDFNVINEEFNNLISKYSDFDAKILLKKKHSFRVERYARRIAHKEGLDENLSDLIGLLHDIGRFEQLRRFNTFIDRYSIDHATEGVNMLLKDNYISKYIKNKNYHKIILDAIENHNKFKIADDIVGESFTYSKLIRDADKVDILDYYKFEDPQFVFNLKEVNASKISDEAYNAFKEQKQIGSGRIKTAADGFLNTISFIFDMYFKETYRCVKENNSVNDLIDLLDKEKMDPRFEEIRNIANKYIDFRINE